MYNLFSAMMHYWNINAGRQNKFFCLSASIVTLKIKKLQFFDTNNFGKKKRFCIFVTQLKRWFLGTFSINIMSIKISK